MRTNKDRHAIFSWMPSHRASQILSIASFGSKLKCCWSCCYFMRKMKDRHAFFSWMPSHRASQIFSIGSFGSTLNCYCCWCYSMRKHKDRHAFSIRFSVECHAFSAETAHRSIERWNGTSFYRRTCILSWFCMSLYRTTWTISAEKCVRMWMACGWHNKREGPPCKTRCSHKSMHKICEHHFVPFRSACVASGARHAFSGRSGSINTAGTDLPGEDQLEFHRTACVPSWCN